MQWESDHRECVLQGESEWYRLTLTYPQHSVSHPCLVPAKMDTPQHRHLSCSDTPEEMSTNGSYPCLSFSFLPREHSCSRSAAPSLLHSSLNLQGFHSSHLIKGPEGTSHQVAGDLEQAGPVRGTCTVSRQESPHCACDTCKPSIYLTYIIQEINGILLFPCNKFSIKSFHFLSIIII